MALGAALATGKPQAFAVVPGPGFLDASAALLQAYAMNAPVLGIVGQIPQGDVDRGFGQLHEMRDQLGLASHIAKYTARIQHAAGGAGGRRRGRSPRCSRGVPRPAVVECPMDVWGKPGPVRLAAAGGAGAAAGR